MANKDGSRSYDVSADQKLFVIVDTVTNKILSPTIFNDQEIAKVCIERNTYWIDPIKPWPRLVYLLQSLGAPGGGCWFCGLKDPIIPLLFCSEWDTYFHAGCALAQMDEHGHWRSDPELPDFISVLELALA